MSAESTPYGLIPINKIGGQSNAGAFREFPMAANNSAAIFNGDLVVLSDGQPAAVGQLHPLRLIFQRLLATPKTQHRVLLVYVLVAVTLTLMVSSSSVTTFLRT